ncbi:Myb-like DNA-binding domain [Phytophthora infestans]|uniref:Myb-like DNA-binding domain n=1 Tax=Phytophthora infestans TaxID=4787 RepID=A0A833T9V1_PHYIN|nr:Myb-like DNA-binding domain [Phytophthora infestans]
MTITQSVQQEFQDDETKVLICIPCISNSLQQHPSTPALLLQVPTRTAESTKGERWTEDEHERFLLGMELFKEGPWKKIANVVGTRDARQTMSHAQKYRQKIKRRKLRLPATEPPRRADASRATSSTKKLRTTRPVETVTTATCVANRVVERSRSCDVSPSVQPPREALDDAPRVISGSERSLEESSAVDSADGNTQGLITETDTSAGTRMNQQLDATEPLAHRLGGSQ